MLPWREAALEHLLCQITGVLPKLLMEIMIPNTAPYFQVSSRCLCENERQTHRRLLCRDSGLEPSGWFSRS